MNSEELRFFLQGATSLDVAEPNPLEEGSWLTDKTWSEIIAAEKLSSMSHFADEFKSDLSAWEGVFVSDDPLADIEEIVNGTYSPFQKLCILRAIRPDALAPAVQMFIGQVGLVICLVMSVCFFTFELVHATVPRHATPHYLTYLQLGVLFVTHQPSPFSLLCIWVYHRLIPLTRQHRTL